MNTTTTHPSPIIPPPPRYRSKRLNILMRLTTPDNIEDMITAIKNLIHPHQPLITRLRINAALSSLRTRRLQFIQSQPHKNNEIHWP